MEILSWLLNGHSDLSGLDYFINFLFGLAGASVSVVAQNPKVLLPRWTETGWELGGLSTLLVGSLCAIAIGYKVPVAFIVGLISPSAVPLLLKIVPRIVDQLRQSIVNSLGGK